MIKAIFASAMDGGFGYKGRLPWTTVKEDLSHFKNITNNKAIVMGRKTWETLPTLSNRINIVMTKDRTFRDKHNVTVCDCIDNLILGSHTFPEIDFYLIGGSELLSVENLKHCEEIYHTTIKGTFEHDVKIKEDVISYLNTLKHEVIKETDKCIIRRYYAEL